MTFAFLLFAIIVSTVCSLRTNRSSALERYNYGCCYRSRTTSFVAPIRSMSELSNIYALKDTSSIKDIPILFENSSIVAINKPHGIPYHDDPVSGTPGIVSLLRDQRHRQNQLHHQQQQQQQGGEDENGSIERLYGVHRLDRVTSGILLFAKSSRVASILMEKFASSAKRNTTNQGGRYYSGNNKDGDDGIIKFYFGISGKKPTKKKQGWLNGRMVKGRRGSYKLLPTNNNTRIDNSIDHHKKFTDDVGDDDVEYEYEGPVKTVGNYASTRFYTAGLGHLPLISSSVSNIMGRTNEEDSEQRIVPKTAILFRPHTGKTHQLRVAAKSLGLPLLGDDRYGGKRVAANEPEDVSSGSSSSCAATKERERSNIVRTCLHASAIHFNLDGESVTIWSPPPFGAAFGSYQNQGQENDKECINEVFEHMMEKYCDCQPIIDAMHKNRRISSTT